MKSKRPVIRRMASDVGELSAVVQSFIRPSTNYTGGPGCGIVSDSATSFGQPFNELEGGVFATTWDGDGVKICMSSFIFTLQAESLLQGTGTEHGYPTSKDYLLWWCHSADTASIKAAFSSTKCDPKAFFKAQQMVLNINLCGRSQCPGRYTY
jgi:hypothetical protein